MKKLIALLLCFALMGCGITAGSIRKYELPPDYKAEMEDILDHFNDAFSLRNKYSIEILSEKELSALNKSGSPFIKQNDPAGVSTIYMDDLCIKYLYANPYIYVYRKMYLVSLVAHEICHREYNLPDNPIETHLQVDYKAIDMVKQFGIEWFEYSWALASFEQYAGIKRTGGEWQLLGTIFLKAGVAYTTGILYEESDLFQRAMIINDNLGRTDKSWSQRRGKRWRNYFDNKKIWDFPDKQ